MASGNLDVSGVASLGGTSYDLTVDDTTGVSVGDNVGCPLASGGSGAYSVTAVPDGTSLTVSARTDPYGIAYGSPGTTGTGADNGWFATPGVGGGLVVPESAPGGSWARSEQADTVTPGYSPGRLSLHSTDPLGEAAAAGTIYFHRYGGSRLALYDGADWTYLPIAATAASVALSGGTASKPHDVFAYNNSGDLALELLVWTDATNRATTLTRVDGVLTKTGDSTRRYLGSVYLDGSKQATFQASSAKLDLWNVANRVSIACEVEEATASWVYSTATLRQANGSTSNQVQIMQGLDREAVLATYSLYVSNSLLVAASIGVGIDSSTVSSANWNGVQGSSSSVPGHAYYSGNPGEGLRTVRALEAGGSSGTTTFYSGGYAGLSVTSWH